MFHPVGRFGTLPGYLLPLSLVLDTVPLGSGGQGHVDAGAACWSVEYFSSMYAMEILLAGES